jgi:flagellar motility protein MotE (MotC chaperone)
MKKICLNILIVLLFGLVFVSYPLLIYAQEDLVQLLKKKNAEIIEKEETLKKEEERLLTLKKDIAEMINKYSKILNDLENAIKKVEAIKRERLEHLIKTYEAMPPEKAAQHISAMDEQTAVNILSGMKNKKAALILSNMDSKKATILTEAIYNPVKKFPAQ